MNREVRICVDSFPYEKEIHKICDYSGEQIYSKLALPLFTEEGGRIVGLACASYVISPDKKLYKFALRSELYWSDGKKVTAEEYKNSFILICSDKSNRFKSLLSDIYGYKELSEGNPSVFGVFTEGDDILYIKLRNVNLFFINIMCAYVLSPYRSDRKNIHCGPYEINYIDEKIFSLKENNYYSLDSQSQCESVKKIIYTNIGALNKINNPYISFLRKKTDVTCDTAIYYNRYKSYLLHKEFQYRKINVFMLLSPGSMFNDIPYQIISLLPKIIDRNRICDELDGVPKPIYSYQDIFFDGNVYERESNEVHEGPTTEFDLHVSLEKYYPNEIVFSSLKRQFKQYNINLIKKIDKYGVWDSESHIRLELRKPVISSPIVLYKADIFRGYMNDNDFKLALLLYSKVISSDSLDEHMKCYKYMDSMLISRGISIPLIELPGLFFCKNILNVSSIYQVGKYIKVLK